MNDSKPTTEANESLDLEVLVTGLTLKKIRGRSFKKILEKRKG